jgi:hypothetical protein
MVHNEIDQLLVAKGEQHRILDELGEVSAGINFGAQIFPSGANPHADHPATQHRQPRSVCMCPARASRVESADLYEFCGILLGLA